MQDTKVSRPAKRKVKRRGRNEGSIYQRSDGRWCASLTVGYDENGMRKRQVVYGKTKTEVQEKLDEKKEQKRVGAVVDTNRLTVAQYLKSYLDSAEVRETTLVNYRAIVKNHINPQIGGLNLTKVAPMHLRTLYAGLPTKGVKHHCHAILKKAFRLAIKDGLLSRNPCELIERPKLDKHEMQPLNQEEVGKLLAAAADHRIAALYILAIDTGMRWGELMGLQWQDIDLKSGKLSVRRKVQEISGRTKVTQLKTKASKRHIDISQRSIDALWDHKARMLAEGRAAHPFVFCNTRGKHILRGGMNREYWKPLLKKAGISHRRFHDLRHTCATLLLQAGVHPKIVQERLGHSSIVMTLDTYSHVLPTMQKVAADAFNKVLAAGG